MLHTGQADQFARSREPRDTLFGERDRRGGVRRAADGEIRQGDAVEPVLVASERRQERCSEIRDVADDRLQSSVVR